MQYKGLCRRTLTPTFQKASVCLRSYSQHTHPPPTLPDSLLLCHCLWNFFPSIRVSQALISELKISGMQVCTYNSSYIILSVLTISLYLFILFKIKTARNQEKACFGSSHFEIFHPTESRATINKNRSPSRETSVCFDLQFSRATCRCLLHSGCHIPIH